MACTQNSWRVKRRKSSLRIFATQNYGAFGLPRKRHWRTLCTCRESKDSLVISLHLTQQIIDIDGVNARPLVRYRAMAAITLMKLKRFPEALVHIREAKRIAATIYPAGNFNRVNIDMNWLRWYVEQEQWDAALSELTKLQASYAGIDLEPRSELRLALVQAHLDCHTGSVEKGLSIFAEVMPQARLKLVENRQRLAEHEAWYASCKKRASN